MVPGSRLANRFEIDRVAGTGGMGTVYRARDLISGELVALKLLNSTLGAHDAERFTRESQLLSELRHPGIVSYVAHGLTHDGQRFLAMEWLDGESLSARLLRGPLSLAESLTLQQHVAAALSVAHARGIVHRDIKPSNLFLPAGRLDEVKLLDFGIARRASHSLQVTRTGVLVGTPEYMAPEQARGAGNVSPAADIFSLGCVLYECLTGQPPFVGEHIAAVLSKILFEAPRPIREHRAGVPQALAALTARMLANRTELRPCARHHRAFSTKNRRCAERSAAALRTDAWTHP